MAGIGLFGLCAFARFSLVRNLSLVPRRDITSTRPAGKQESLQMVLDISEDARTFTHSQSWPLFLR